MAEQLPVEKLNGLFFRVCDAAVDLFKVPLGLCVHLISRDGGQNTERGVFANYLRAYLANALAVAYDLTGKDAYLDAIKAWSDAMLTFQEQMIPKGAYYMLYPRAPFSPSGTWCVCDASEIALGVLATAVRCRHPLEKQRYLRSVEAYANLVLDNYAGPNGGILNGIWLPFDGEWWASTASSGALFFKLYDETGNRRYLEAALNTVHWFASLESLRRASRDEKFITYNAPGEDNPYPANPKQSGSGILRQLHLYNAGAPHLFGRGLAMEGAVRRELDFFVCWCSENLLGNGHSALFAKTGYDTRRIDGVIVNGTKLGGVPCQLYGLARQGAVPADMAALADRELQRIVTEIASREDLLVTEFVAFASVSMAERLCPGGVLRNSVPLYQTPVPPPGA